MTKPGLRSMWMAAWLAALGAGCDGGASSTPAAMPTGARCTMAREVPCVDQSVAGLALKNTVNPAVVKNTALTGGVFESSVDASGGGLTPTQSYVYVKFTPNGLEKVAVSDEDAFRSMDWDLALRRYIVRVNGGSSGPSCVDAALTSSASLATVTTVPPALGYETDLFLEAPACMLGADQAPAGGPLTAVSGYYRYEACLIMTDALFVVRLANGGTVGLQVAGYYNKEVQDYCNANGKLPGGTSGAGIFTLRWKFLAAS